MKSKYTFDKTGKCDLHIHTTASDGTVPPGAVAALAKKQGFSLIAVTDHDTLDGVDEAVTAGENEGICVVPGVEISAGREHEVHVLGYGMGKSDALENMLERMKQSREQRLEEMLLRLEKNGILIDAAALSTRGTVGRAHIAQAMVEKGYVSCVREAFSRYLSKGKCAYVEREKPSVHQAIELIREAGGIPVIAHPGQKKGETYWTHARLHTAMDHGLAGIEVYHLSHQEYQLKYFARAAQELGLLITGGSDFHGMVKPDVMLGSGLERWKTRDTNVSAFIEQLNRNSEKNN